MKMIVGLGNPGKEYENTRHNVGFMVLDSFVPNFHMEKKFEAAIKEDNIQGNKCIFVKPFTFMNESGFSVAKIAKYYDILPEDILVIQDDMDLAFEHYKLKMDSSSGGHNGIKSIINSLNTEHFCRLKIGISHDENGDTINYVLGKFSKSEIQFLQEHYSLFQEIIESFIVQGIHKTMNIYNTR